MTNERYFPVLVYFETYDKDGNIVGQIKLVYDPEQLPREYIIVRTSCFWQSQ